MIVRRSLFFFKRITEFIIIYITYFSTMNELAKVRSSTSREIASTGLATSKLPATGRELSARTIRQARAYHSINP